jgi:hypothetical protein
MSDSERIIKEGSYLLHGVSPAIRDAVTRIMRSKSDFLDVPSDVVADETFGKSAVSRVSVGTQAGIYQIQRRSRGLSVPPGSTSSR